MASPHKDSHTNVCVCVCVCVCAHSLTSVLVTELFTGVSRSLATVVSYPLGGGVGLVVQGQFSWI